MLNQKGRDLLQQRPGPFDARMQGGADVVNQYFHKSVESYKS